MKIEELTLEEIDNLLPQLQKQLEEAQKPPIDELVGIKFEEEWELVQECLKEQLQNELEQTYKGLYLFTVLENVLQPFIGEERTKKFLSVANSCVKEKSFKGTQKFYYEVEDPVQRAIARLSFAVLQLNMNFAKSSKVKATINECVNVSENVRDVFKTYQQFELV
jgi:hypothetical protein